MLGKKWTATELREAESQWVIALNHRHIEAVKKLTVIREP